jgi:hypothetical protein
MITFHFKIVPAHVAYHMISNTAPQRFVSGKCNPGIVRFQNAAWRKDRAANVQLLADNEMRIRLNGGSYPPFEGHEEHIAIMENLLPSWREYLQQPRKNIHDYLRNAKTIVGTISHS